MKNFLEKATHLRTQLEIWIEQLELPFSTFLEAGEEGLLDIQVRGITREKSTFVDHIVQPNRSLPKEVIKAMCLGVVHIEDALEYYGKSHEMGLASMVHAAEEVGFCCGVSFGAGHLDKRRRVALSASGKKGAQSLHGPRIELKAWALAQAKSNRGSHKDIARKLATQIPQHLANASKDPERLIYDTLRAHQKPN